VVSRKRILVVYYSLSGNTERVAKELAARLDADLEQIREQANRRGFIGYLRAAYDSLRANPVQLIGPHTKAGEYALTIVGTPIWAGKITPAARACLKSIRDEVNDVAFFTTSGSTPAEGVVPTMERLVGRKALAFVGLTDRELRDAATRERKVQAFTGLLRTRTTPVNAQQELERVHL
jgi:flavodoxin